MHAIIEQIFKGNEACRVQVFDIRVRRYVLRFRFRCCSWYYFRHCSSSTEAVWFRISRGRYLPQCIIGRKLPQPKMMPTSGTAKMAIARHLAALKRVMAKK